MPSRSRAVVPHQGRKPRSASARAMSPNSRSSFTAPWASPRSSTSGPTSSGCSPSTRCSAAAPITIAGMPPSAAVPFKPERSAIHGSHLQRRRTRLRAGSSRVHRGQPDARDKARHRADAVGILRPRHRDGLAARPAQERLGRAGLAGGPWRAGLTPAQRWIFESESARAGVPNVNVMGVKMVGPVIIGFGSPEQKNFYLPKILSGEDYWCQGYSEPGSGSDLSSLKTRAVRDGDDYIINGTKIWTTHAHHANRMFALV